MGKNKELFPELADLGSVAALQAWLLGYGFEVTGTKVKLQHPDFQRAHPTAEQPGAFGGDAETSATQQKKKKRKTPASCQRPRGRSTSQKTLGRQPRLRPLYQYINFEMPELMLPSGDHVPEVAQPNQVPAGPGITTAPQLPDTWISSALEISAPEASNTFMPIDVDGMMTYEAHQKELYFGSFCLVQMYDKGTKEGSQFKSSFKTDPKLA
ncbi:uncharacterized protein [Phaenicophaeus curvirostris]|uniref:uncharacterized protein n=1 Tax=Phaenicophaeus curvirostris TaxID=33595 RepID=UPI0037F0EB6E